ncbi:MAG: hypothetical protein ACKVZ0_23750 [Gemmatimonadales bacterium]
MATRRPKDDDEKPPTGRIHPKFGARKHHVGHRTAQTYRQRFLKKYARKKAPLGVAAYNRAIFDTILAQEGCVGIRFYPGIDAEGRLTLLFCGVHAEGGDILAGTIGDTPWRCPPWCSDVNGILRF